MFERPARRASRSRTAITLAAACIAAACALPAAADGAPGLYERRDGALVPIPALETRVELHVTGMLVRGVVAQSFVSRGEGVLEAVYAFPLPAGASVDRMTVRVGTRTIESVVREREEARVTYERAKSDGRKAALVETRRDLGYSISVTGINPGERVDVLLEYRHEADHGAGAFRTAFPMTVTPRYGEASAAVPGGGPAHPVAAVGGSAGAARAVVEARIDAGVPLEAVESPSHAIDVSWEGETWVARLAGGAAPMDRDFVLEWRPLLADEPLAMSFVEPGDGSDGHAYGLLALVPPADAGPSALPTDTLFVVDVSGSMAGRSIEQAKEALAASIGRLSGRDRFDVLAFNQGQAAFAGRFVAVDAASREAADAWIGRLEARGGTEIYDALRVAAAMASRAADGVVSRVVFLTDGAVQRDEAALRELTAALGDARLHVIGLGHAPNRPLLRSLARAGRGLAEFVAGGDATTNRIDTFFSRLDRPVLAGVELGFEGAGAVSILPDPIPDLHAGEPLVVSFRLPAERVPHAVVVRGQTHDGPAERRFALRTADGSGRGIAARWASRRVAAALDALHAGADAAAVRDEVVALGLAHGLVTPYTSRVAVETVATAHGTPATARVPLAGPGSGAASVALPRGATNGPLWRLVGAALLLAGVLMLTLPAAARARR